MLYCSKKMTNDGIKKLHNLEELHANVNINFDGIKNLKKLKNVYLYR